MLGAATLLPYLVRAMSPVYSTRTRFKWIGEGPPRASLNLAEMEGWFLETTTFVEAAQEIGIRDMDRKFESETDPEGHPWAEHKRPYGGEGILRLTTQMYQDSIDPDTWQVTHRGLYFDTSNLPPYWIYHEQPRGTPSKRGLARRSFIPLTLRAQEELTILFNEWVDQGMIVGSRGRVREFRAPTGRFASFNV